ncbi:MerR family transcriptional regulator [Streptomyces sp. ACA25]|uniref:MerR family transcriptional regulator n=1 Tax=Streptomyces sp. ACA25 TaxID=3022596 RepID=UPI0023071376|nr:MerR family transcriptional regulator [Streptomyces sp. ACA25]MDB1089602.1 MerR family transcriptional regulator [Streptomyces sp. ACA25]
MRLAELSERSGVPTATIKYYLRERLLPPGTRVTATQAEYGAEHLRRLRLVRALIQVGRVPVAAAREVMAALEDDTLDRHEQLGTAVGALPHGPDPAEEDPATGTARRKADELLTLLGWEPGTDYPAHRMLISSLSTLVRLGYPCDTEQLLPYGRTAAGLAAHDLDLIEKFDEPITQVEAAVALTVLYEPVLLSLRRLAHAEESGRRFGSGGPGQHGSPEEPGAAPG